MLDVVKLQMLSKNETAVNLLKFFQKCREISNLTNLDSFLRFLNKTGVSIVHSDYEAFFKSLQNLGVGYFDPAKKHMFIWKYSFNNVADQVLHPNRKITIKSWAEDDFEDMLEATPIPAKKLVAEEAGLTRKGRPKGSKNKTKQPNDIVFTFKTSKGDVSLDLADTVSLINQVSQLKQTLKVS